MTSLAKRAKNKLQRVALRKTAGIRSAWRVGVVGSGGIAPDHVQGYESTRVAHIVAFNDVSPVSLAGMLDQVPHAKGYKDLQQMLANERLDLVSICTWPDSHASLVAQVAAAGIKGIMCEKPLALTMSEVDAMVAAAAQHGCRLAGGHQYRFHALFMRAAALVREGRLGNITRARGNIASTLANNGPHLIDTIRFVMGDDKVVSVQCACERERDEWNRGLPAEDGAAGALVFESGVRCDVLTGDRSDGFFSIQIVGDKGSLEVSPNRLVVDGKVVSDGNAEDDYRRRQFSEFIDWVKGKRATYAADAVSSAATAEVVLAMYESARLGNAVQLPLRNKGDVIRQLYPATPPANQSVPAAFPKSHPLAIGEARLASEGGSRAVSGWFGSQPAIGTPELRGVTRVLLSKRLNSVEGTVVAALEEEFAEVYGVKHAVASTSGTAAIHVAIGALNPEPCDEIITTPITDMGSVIPILMANCIPVFADVDPVTGNLTAASIERKITPRTKAVILVHLFGHPADMEPIRDLLRARKIALIEDCAQAHYADYRGKKVGTFGDFACFSLQQSKQITCGDGGITLVNRDDLADRAALFVDKGWNRKQGLRTHLFLGMNYRMTELQGAVARAQLRRLPGLIAQRQETASLLTVRLLKNAPLIRTRVLEEGTRPAWWMYPFTIDQAASGIDIEEFRAELTAEGIRVAREYVPWAVFNYTVLKDQRTYGESRYPFSATNYVPPVMEDFPGFLEFKRNLLYMGWSHNATTKHVEMIAAGIAKVVRALRPSPVMMSHPIAQREPVLERT